MGRWCASDPAFWSLVAGLSPFLCPPVLKKDITADPPTIQATALTGPYTALYCRTKAMPVKAGNQALCPPCLVFQLISAILPMFQMNRQEINRNKSGRNLHYNGSSKG